MKKLILVLVALLATVSSSFPQGVSINKTQAPPDNSAMLDVSSSTSGILIPRMTLADRNSIPSPVEGLLIYQTNSISGFYYFNGSIWIPVGKDILGINDLKDGKYDATSLFLGRGAGMNDDGSSNQNVAVGDSVMGHNTTGHNNTAIGYRAFLANVSGNNNTALGSEALRYSTTGSGNLAVGSSALKANTNGTDNTAVGNIALTACTEGYENTAIGKGALLYNTTGSQNIGIGINVNQNNQEGSHNTIIGYAAGSGTAFHNKSGNVFLGYKAGYYETGSNKLYIENSDATSPLIYAEFDNNLVRINGSLDLTGDLSGVGINDLSDGKTTSTSTYLGKGTGAGNAGNLSKNVAVGDSALYTNVIGINNNALGYMALKLNTGDRNNAVGYQALYSNTTGDDNAAYGFRSLYANDTGYYNTAYGSESGYYNKGGSLNTIIGYKAGRGPTYHIKSGNVFVGYMAGYNDTVDNNTAVGTEAMFANTSGDKNTATGYRALYSNITGVKNTSVGHQSLYFNASGSGNTIMGTNANAADTSGSNNTIIGCEAGMGTVYHSKSGNVFLGYRAGINDTTDNKLYIENSGSASPLIWGDFANDTVRINGTLDIADAYAFPTVDGTNGQVLKTDGDGELSWGSDAGATDINGLTDGKSDNNSLFLGQFAGLGHNGTDLQNTGIGKNALVSNQTGTLNTAVGFEALKTSIQDKNTAVGSEALSSLLIGESNTAVGAQSLLALGSDYGNTALGGNAGYLVYGSFNTFLGAYTAGRSPAHDLDGCVFVGYRAGYYESTNNKLYIENSDSSTPLIWGDFAHDTVRINGTLDIRGEYHFPRVDGADGQLLKTDGNGLMSWTYEDEGVEEIDDLLDGKTDADNMFLGTSAGEDNIAQYNIGIGKEALQNNTNGSYNTALGYNSLKMMTNNSNNTAIGSYALNQNTGYQNTSLGAKSLYNNDGGDNNTAVGYMAGNIQLGGDYNTFLGSYAGGGTSLQSISGSVFIGYEAGLNETTNNKLYIENSDSDTPLIYGDFDYDTVRINGTLDINGEYHFPDTKGTNKQILKTNASGDVVWDDMGFSVGDYAQGGVVFWVDNTGLHGLVCAIVDQDPNMRWYAGTYGVTRAQGNGPFSGEMNTAVAISSQVSIGDDGSDYAAFICSDYMVSQAGRWWGDWYLPSKKELNLMYNNKATIDITATDNGGTSLVNYYYWSSTESGSSSSWAQNFSDGTQASLDKSNTYVVRAIRAF